MIHSFIQFIQEIVLPLGAFGVFFAEVIEEIIVPIPSALVLLASGFLLLKGSFSLNLLRDLFFTITLPASLGLTLGSLVIYYLGFAGGKPFIEKYGNFLGISWQEVLDFDAKMEKSKYDEILFVIARFFPIVPSSLIAIFSGVTRMPIKKYIVLTFIGSLIKATILGLIGYKVGELYHQYADKIDKMENTGLVVCLILLLSFFTYRIYRKNLKDKIVR